MSVINRKPYIESVVESLTSLQLGTLATILNGAESTIFRSFINTDYPITTEDKGVSHCVLETKDKVFTGYLLFNNSYCVLVSYETISQKLKIVKINYANDTYEIVDEELNINEFRRIVEDRKVNVTIDSNDVSANPELTGTEAKLSSIEIDGTKFKVDTLPALPLTTADKTFVLKLVNGTLTWVEEVEQTEQTAEQTAD